MLTLDKPSGIATHTSLSPEEAKQKALARTDGFLEFVAQRSDRLLWPVHRLDKGTCGLLLAAESSEEAAELSRDFETNAIAKTYFFLTDRRPKKLETVKESLIKVESHITRMKSGRATEASYASFAPTKIEPINAVTDFVFEKTLGKFDLWKAMPTTGKPHQIRLHAESIGIPILGDSEHHGSDFPTLCLFAESVEFKKTNYRLESPAPFWKEQNISDWSSTRIALAVAIDRRVRSWRSLQMPLPEAVRWIHTEIAGVKIDQLGAIISVGLFNSAAEKTKTELIELLNSNRWSQWIMTTRNNRGAQPNQEVRELSAENLPERWQISENEMRFEMRRDTGLSFGIFLDQRQNRKWIRSSANGKSVLNLFSYTGGFSVAAALGGATKVVSVDTNSAVLNWAQENFRINNLETQSPQFEFRKIDCIEYLAWAEKQKLLFDLIVCDPPSFSRGEKKRVFRIESELESLIKSLIAVLAPGGSILFSSNFEGWTQDQLIKRVRAMLGQYQRERPKLSLQPGPTPDLDFEMPFEERAQKSFLIVESTTTK